MMGAALEDNTQVIEKDPDHSQVHQIIEGDTGHTQVLRVTRKGLLRLKTRVTPTANSLGRQARLRSRLCHCARPVTLLITLLCLVEEP